MKFIITVLLFALCVLPACAAPEANYLTFYQEALTRFSLGAKRSFTDELHLGDAAIRLWARTKNEEARDYAVRSFEAALADPKFDLRDFHALRSFARLALQLKKLGLLKAAWQPRVNQLAQAQLGTFLKSNDDGDYNIRLAQILGYANLLQLLDGGDYPPRAAVQKKIDDYWKLLVATGDLDEDAANYDSLGAVFLIDLARTLNRENDLRSPGFRRMFERFQDIISPSGLMPEYGDAYFSYNELWLDRIYLLEYAAKIYDDASFRAAARQLAARPGLEAPGMDQLFRATGLIDLELSNAAPQVSKTSPSLVTYRARRGDAKPLIDKLILRTGRERGDAMVMLDLYASGSHSHPEKGPSVAYYEVAGVPLFHNMGRHQTRSAICGNLPWAMPATDEFPGVWKENQWFTMRLPVNYLNGENGRYSIAPQMSLRNFQERSGTKFLTFDNLRLEGAAGVKLVDDFEDKSRWTERVRKLAELVTDKTQGTFAESVAWPTLPSGELPRKLPQRPTQSFTASEYDYLKFDLEYNGAKPYMHIRGLGQQVDLGDQFLPTRIESASAQQRGRDAYGEVRYAEYLSPGTTLTRRFVLTAEGYLIVRDVVQAGKAQDGWNAAQLWQLYSLKSRGADWFASEDDGAFPGANGPQTRAMLVKYDAKSSVAEVVQPYFAPNPKNRKAERFFTTFSARKIASGVPQIYTQVIAPFDPAKDTPESLAARIVFTTNGATIDGVKVDFSADSWAVTRRKN